MYRRLRAVVTRFAWAASLLPCLHSGVAAAQCLPLAAAQARAIDSYSDREPSRAVREATRQLQALSPATDPFLAAQWYAIVADAENQRSNGSAARNAVTEARRLISRLPDDPAVRRLQQRLTIAEANAAQLMGESDAAIALLDPLIAASGGASLERSCAMVVRAQARSELNQADLAAADGTAAYRIAESGGWEEPRIASAYALAVIYRRSGLLPDAEHMIDEVTEYAQREGYLPLLATATFVRGQILVDARQFAQARAALEVSRSTAERIGDRLGAAASRVPLCIALIGQSEWLQAEQMCRGGEPEFVAANRQDLAALVLGLQARIDLGRARPAAALVKLDRLLDAQPATLQPRFVPQFLRDRARALGALGRFQRAYTDLRRAAELEQAADLEQRNRAVAILSATAASERLVAANRTLEERNAHQREIIASRELTQRLWIGLAAAAVLLCLLFAYLLASTWRQERRLRHQEAILRTASSNAPDALLLLDRERNVRFSNRNLFGAGPAHTADSPLDMQVPPATAPALRAAVDELFGRRGAVNFTTSFPDAQGTTRQFELRGVPVLEGGELIGATLRAIDVTELRSLEREVIDVASRERQRLSSDLHEGLGQELTGISLLLRSVATSLERGGADVRALLAEAIMHVARTIDLTRELARGLSPVHIERGSLSMALERLGREVGPRLRIQVTARSEPEDVSVSEVAADHIYRIVYEAITNAARHSGCRHVTTALRVDSGMLELSITDDGTGLRAGEAKRDGLGMKMMAYRAHLLGGTLDVAADRGAGTRITLTVPMARIAA